MKCTASAAARSVVAPGRVRDGRESGFTWCRSIGRRATGRPGACVAWGGKETSAWRVSWLVRRRFEPAAKGGRRVSRRRGGPAQERALERGEKRAHGDDGEGDDQQLPEDLEGGEGAEAWYQLVE